MTKLKHGMLFEEFVLTLNEGYMSPGHKVKFTHEKDELKDKEGTIKTCDGQFADIEVDGKMVRRNVSSLLDLSMDESVEESNEEKDNTPAEEMGFRVAYNYDTDKGHKNGNINVRAANAEDAVKNAKTALAAKGINRPYALRAFKQNMV